MAKAIRWQIPFVSVTGKHYRIDIYDEGWTGSITTLTAGPNPFTTDEDASDDFFAPIRTQTGNIEVCTALPDGGMLTLDEILPANNIARPVRLMNTDSNSIEWQGFLSCEAYSQDYVGIPQILQLPIISVLEAMDSVEVEMADKMMFNRIIAHLLYAMQTITDKSGMDLFTNIVTPAYCQDALINKYLYNNVYFTADQVVSGDNIVVEVHSISCKQILLQIAQFFGCCWREVGTDLYLEAISENLSYTAFAYKQFADKYLNNTGETISSPRALLTQNLADCEWMGTGHQKSVIQGMRRVKVSTSLKDFECSIGLQECPVGSLIENPEERHEENGEVYVNTNETFYSLAEHKHYLTKAIFPTDLTDASLLLVSTLTDINYLRTIFWETSEFRQYYYELVVNQTKGSNTGLNHYITSFMAWYRDKNEDLQSGLMVCGVPRNLYWSTQPIQGRAWNKYELTDSNYLFRQRTPLTFAASKGYLKININTLAWSNAPGTMPSIVYGATVFPTLTVAVRFGDYWMYKDGDVYLWDSAFRTIDFPLEKKATDEELKTLGNWDESMGIDEGDGIFIKIPSFMVGHVYVYIYPFVNALCADPYTNSMFDVFINKLDVEYVPLKEELLTDRSENTYTTATGAAFSDELDMGLNIATNANNTKVATMLWESDGTTPVKLLSLGSETIRPEVDLLNRLAEYYKQSRQTVKLEVRHLQHPLPLLWLNGINDNKTYTPIAESRDWQLEISTLTCMELPNE